MNDLTKLYRKLDPRDTLQPDAETLARIAAVRGDTGPGDSAQAAIVALARELEPESQQVVATLRGPTVVPFVARLGRRAWVPAALAAGVALAAVLAIPRPSDVETPPPAVAAAAPEQAPIVAPDGDAMFVMSFEPGETAPAQGSDDVFSGDFDS